MGKNVAVFVDVANIFYAAKAAGVDIDYVTLLKAAVAGRDFVRAYAYTGLDPDNENQRNFHAFLARHGYKVVSKDIRKYGDGKVKANLDIELVVDMMKTARNLDVAIVISGDGDFAPAIRAVQEMGVRVEVISFRGNTSSDLIEVADLFSDIVQLAKVDRASTRSGRRVADDEDDLSMTEVPDKQTEGTGRPHGRTRSRTRTPETAVASREVAATGRAPRRSSEQPEIAVASAGPLTVMPGERLSRVATASIPASDLARELVEEIEDIEIDDEVAALGEVVATAGLDGADGETRRRRRRGGRGRGRGRSRDEFAAEDGADRATGERPTELPAERPVERPVAARPIERTPIERAPIERTPVRALDEEPVAPRGPKPTPFGSFWDSQIGVPTAPRTQNLTPLPVDEDDDEPEIPEYLLAERRRGAQPQRSGNRVQPRGNRAGYSAAVDRERYGGNRASGGVGTGGMNRYPDVSRNQPGGGQSSGGGQPIGGGQRPAPRQPQRQVPLPQNRPERGANRSEEPWSEVPPEIEELLRAQMAARGGRQPERAPERSHAPASIARDEVPGAQDEGAIGALTADPTSSAASAVPAPARRGRPRRTDSPVAAETTATRDGSTAEGPTAATEAPTGTARGRGRRPVAAAAETASAATSTGDARSADVPEPSAPARPRGRRPAAGAEPAAASSASAAPAAEPSTESASASSPTRGRRPRTAASTSADSGAASTAPAPAPASIDVPAAGETASSAVPRRRATRSAATASNADAGSTGAEESAPRPRTVRRKAGSTEA